MKNHYKILVLAAMLIPTSSCKKFLETKPQSDLVIENYYQTASQVKNALNGVYYAMNTNVVWYSSNYPCFIAQGSDESYNRVAAAQSVEHFSSLSSDTHVANLWKQIYIGIDRANRLLENIDQATDLAADQKEIIIGETKFLRAYYHFFATQWWGDVPLRLKSTNVPDDTNIMFTPQKDVYDWVIAEMTDAEALLAKQQATDIQPYNSGRVVQTTVDGILARVCLYAAGVPVNDTKRYADALKWANKAISSNIHRLNPSFEQVFINHSADLYDTFYKESMWECEFIWVPTVTGLRAYSSAQQMIGINDGTSNPNGKTSGYVYSTPILYRAYDSYYNPIRSTDNSPDYRRDVTCATFNYTGGSPTVPSTRSPLAYNANGWWLRWPGKWKRENETVVPKNDSNTPENWPILRYSDILLMSAEADNELNGPTPNAIAAVNQIRARAYGALTNPATNGIELTLVSGGAGYRAAPTTITQVDGTSTEVATIGSTISGTTVTSLTMSTTGKYSVAPGTVYLGTAWTPATTYPVNAQVVNAAKLYTVTTAGTSTTTPPTQTSGASTAATTGAVFTYVGPAATATATLLTGQLKPAQYASKDVFRQTIMDERMRELAYEGFRRQDLKRWGLLVQAVKTRSDLALNGSLARFPNGVQVIGACPTSSQAIATVDGTNISDKWIYLPIPSAEIANNKYAKQNPGF